MIPIRQTIRVLVVEDSSTQALKLRGTLESAGFEVEVALGGCEGLDTFAAAHFDLVLSDVVMPGLSGYELCRRIQGDARGRDIPVILLTTLKEPRDIILGLESGADNFISKPYDADRLVARIDAVLARLDRSRESQLEGKIEIGFMGVQFTNTSSKEQALTFLASTFEDFVQAQRREHEVRLVQVRERLEADAARNREELLRIEKETLDGMLRDLTATQQELRQVNGELDRKVSELAKANLALFEMNRLKGDFLATISHELRTPLNAIIGFSEVLEGCGQLGDRNRRYAANIQASGKMLLAMINDILDSAKIESGRMEVCPEDFSIGSLCEALAGLVQPIAERKVIELEYQIDEVIPPLRQDPRKLRQVIYNLLCNAIKFTPSGGQVALRARSEGAHVSISVADTGIGIALEDHEKIFEKFRQVRPSERTDGVLSREHHGTGLGLSIARELTRLLGGDVSLESRPGEGSTFTVRIPRQLSGHRRFDANRSRRPLGDMEGRRVENRIVHRVEPGEDRCALAVHQRGALAGQVAGADPDRIDAGVD